MAADSRPSVVADVLDEFAADAVAHGLDSSDLLLSDGEVTAVLAEQRSWRTSDCPLLSPTLDEASADDLSQGEQAVRMVACFACSSANHDADWRSSPIPETS